MINPNKNVIPKCFYGNLDFSNFYDEWPFEIEKNLRIAFYFVIGHHTWRIFYLQIFSRKSQLFEILQFHHFFTFFLVFFSFLLKVHRFKYPILSICYITEIPYNFLKFAWDFYKSKIFIIVIGVIFLSSYLYARSYCYFGEFISAVIFQFDYSKIVFPKMTLFMILNLAALGFFNLYLTYFILVGLMLKFFPKREKKNQ